MTTTADNAPGTIPPSDGQWFYALDNAQHGPYSLAVMHEMIECRTIAPDDLVWTAGMPQWLPAREVPELADVIAKLPPLAALHPQLDYGLAATHYVADTGVQPATFGTRFVAYLIDMMLLQLAGTIISTGFQLGVDWLANPLYRPDPWQVGLTNLTVNLCIGWVYFAMMESSARRPTLGKMAMGLIVGNMKGEPITFGRASGRYFAKKISDMTCLIGYLMATRQPLHQALHDQIASTLVIKKPK